MQNWIYLVSFLVHFFFFSVQKIDIISPRGHQNVVWCLLIKTGDKLHNKHFLHFHLWPEVKEFFLWENSRQQRMVQRLIPWLKGCHYIYHNRTNTHFLSFKCTDGTVSRLCEVASLILIPKSNVYQIIIIISRTFLRMLKLKWNSCFSTLVF